MCVRALARVARERETRWLNRDSKTLLIKHPITCKIYRSPEAIYCWDRAWPFEWCNQKSACEQHEQNRFLFFFCLLCVCLHESISDGLWVSDWLLKHSNIHFFAFGLTLSFRSIEWSSLHFPRYNNINFRKRIEYLASNGRFKWRILLVPTARISPSCFSILCKIQNLCCVIV